MKIKEECESSGKKMEPPAEERQNTIRESKWKESIKPLVDKYSRAVEVKSSSVFDDVPTSSVKIIFETPFTDEFSFKKHYELLWSIKNSSFQSMCECRYELQIENLIRRIKHDRETAKKVRAVNIISQKWLEYMYRPDGLCATELAFSVSQPSLTARASTARASSTGLRVKTLSNAFPVEIDDNKLVGFLKKVIKEEKKNDFAIFDADKLKLWKVNILTENENYKLTAVQNINVNIKDDLEGEELRPVSKINITHRHHRKRPDEVKRFSAPPRMDVRQKFSVDGYSANEKIHKYLYLKK
ncbi:hypothetical protein Glove_219g15 [Diversispora epigaea]|uniref:Crinkler effector protein N-terminal domain-containing protein n=1 Tax=Diversispora epigaea TaxID=1348612 RepID=A0A397IIV7_9GLOM|nr:hypothetical protein Glove_219g15 [Diversispora epigaea]